MSRNFERNADQLNRNTGRSDTLYGVNLPPNDSPDAIARDITVVEERLDAILAKVAKILGD